MRDRLKSKASGLRLSPWVCARVCVGAFATKPWHESWRRVLVGPVAWAEFSATGGSRSLSIGAGLSRCRCEGSRGGHVCGPIMSSNAIPIVGACQRAVAAPRFHSHFAHLCSSPPGCSSRGQLSRPQLSLAYSAPTQGILHIAYSRSQGTALMHAEEEDEVAPQWLGGLRSCRILLNPPEPHRPSLPSRAISAMFGHANDNQGNARSRLR